MKKIFKLFIFCGSLYILLALFPSELFAGAWTVSRGRLYTELYCKYYKHSSEFREKDRRYGWAYDGKYRETRIELKFEYGLTDRLNLLAYFPYKDAHWKQEDKKYNAAGFSDFVTGFKYKWFEKPFVFSTQATIKIPGDVNKLEEPDIEEYGELAWDLRLLFGKSFENFPAYIGYEWSYIPVKGIYDDAIRNFFEIGYYPFRKLMFKAELEDYNSIPQRKNIEKDYTIYRVGFVYSFKGGWGEFRKVAGPLFNWEVSYENTFRGKNVGAAEAIITKFIFEF